MSAEIRSIEDALRWGDEWQARAMELERECARLHHLWSKAANWSDLHRASAQIFADAWERVQIERDRAVARYWENG